jgi:large subunit ribosomal protein L17
MEKLFKEVSPRYRERAGGYTRITKLSSYHDDGRKTAQIELV